MIAGLHVLRSWSSEIERRALFEQARRVALAAEVLAQQQSAPCRVSTAHNVNSQESFQSLVLPIDSSSGSRMASCEHFDAYGEGHKLTYFRGDLPTFGSPTLLQRLSQLPFFAEETRSSRVRVGKTVDAPLRWKLTLNRYPVVSPGAATRQPGFPWHRDLTANGAATVILNLGGEGVLEFAEEPISEAAPAVDGMRYSSDHTVAPETTLDVLERVRLADGDLLALTGLARWHYLHRVLASNSSMERISLVYGAW
jgi:hypothetical protein